MCTVVILQNQPNKNPTNMPFWEACLSDQMPVPKWQSPCVPLWTYLKLLKWSWFILMEQSILNYRSDRYSVKFNSDYFLFTILGYLFLLSPLAPSIGFLGLVQRLHKSWFFFLTHILLVISCWFPRRFSVVAISKFIFIHCESFSPWLPGDCSSMLMKKRERHQVKAPFLSLSLFFKH